MTYDYTIDVLAGDGRLLAQAAVTPDWYAALEWVHFEGVRAGELPAVTRAGAGTVVPIWEDERGAPWVARFRVAVQAADGRATARNLSKAYVGDVVRGLATDLVARGGLAAGDTFRWQLRAEPSSAHGDDACDLEIEECPEPLPLTEASLAALADASTFAGSESEATRCLPLFCPAFVLDEIKLSARQAGGVEMGALLVGYLRRDRDADGAGAPRLFVEITAQNPGGGDDRGSDADHVHPGHVGGRPRRRRAAWAE